MSAQVPIAPQSQPAVANHSPATPRSTDEKKDERKDEQKQDGEDG